MFWHSVCVYSETARAFAHCLVQHEGCSVCFCVCVCVCVKVHVVPPSVCPECARSISSRSSSSSANCDPSRAPQTNAPGDDESAVASFALIRQSNNTHTQQVSDSASSSHPKIEDLSVQIVQELQSVVFLILQVFRAVWSLHSGDRTGGSKNLYTECVFVCMHIIVSVNRATDKETHRTHIQIMV